MAIKSISISGYRGFTEPKIINFALPDGHTPGSGISVLVGANNGGKTTVVEVLRFLSSSSNTLDISESRRNQQTNYMVQIIATSPENEKITIETIASGGSETKRSGDSKSQIYIVPSRRHIAPPIRRIY